VATIIVLLIAGGRWLLGRQLISGQSPLTSGQPAPGRPRPTPRDRRPGVDSWAADNKPFDNPTSRTSQTGPTPGQGSGPTPRQGTGPRPGNAPGGARPPRPTPHPPAPSLARPASQPRPLGRPAPPGRPHPAPNGQPAPPPQRPVPAQASRPAPLLEPKPKRKPKPPAPPAPPTSRGLDRPLTPGR
jgi:hypothetical protein